MDADDVGDFGRCSQWYIECMRVLFKQIQRAAKEEPEDAATLAGCGQFLAEKMQTEVRIFTDEAKLITQNSSKEMH